MNTLPRCARLVSLSFAVAVAALSAQAAGPGDSPVLREGRFTSEDVIRQLDKPAVRSWAPAIAGGSAALAAPPSSRASILITFVTGSADLTPRARESLDVLGRAMNDGRLAKLSFTVEGHADPRGGDEFNQKLSQARAQSVRDYLVQTHGLDAARVDAVGKGASELMNRRVPEAAVNRRVTIVAKPKT